MRITTVKNFRVIDRAALPRAKATLPFPCTCLEQWLQISYIHVYLNFHHQLVAFYGFNVWSEQDNLTDTVSNPKQMGNFSASWPHPYETWSHSWWCLIYLQWQTAWVGHFITLCGGPWAIDYSWETFWLNPQQFLNCRVIFLWVSTFYRSSHFPSVTKTSQQRDVRSLFF